MVAVILCAGTGKRLGSLLDRNKCMVRVMDKPLLERTVEAVANIEFVSEIIIVIGYMGDEIRNYFGDSCKDKTIKYAVQHELNGIVGAIQCARNLIGENDFFLLLGDEYLESPKYQKMISGFLDENYFCYLGTVQVEDCNIIRKTYTFDFDSDMQVRCLVEKPEKPFNKYMGTGNIIFRNGILDYIECTPVNVIREERELVDLIQASVNDGKKVGFFELTSYYINLNEADDLYNIKRISSK